MLKNKKKLVLHSCCGPCSTSVIERLIGEYDVHVFYYNPNIYPREEYLKREKTQREYLKNKYSEVVLYTEGEYNYDNFINISHGFENEKEGGKRCCECFRLRLEKTAQFAKKIDADLFSSTLSVSPYKNYKLINKLGLELGLNIGVDYMESNFKKQNGYLRSIQLAKENKLYRQHYCGCEYSKAEREEYIKNKELVNKI